MAGLWRSVAAAVVRARAFAVGAAEPVGTQPRIRKPAGGDTVDTEARSSIASIVAVLEAYGLAEKG